MAKKIRFPLEMADGTQVRTLDELKEHFDLETVLEYYKNGKLLTWLEDRYLETEAEAIQALDENAEDFTQQFCDIFGVECSDTTPVNLEEIALRQDRLKQLREFTDEDIFIDHINQVAFDQEELADLLDQRESSIYLCGGNFMVPVSQKGVTYIGITQPAVKLTGKIPEDADLEDLGIRFEGCRIENPPEQKIKTIQEFIDRTYEKLQIPNHEVIQIDVQPLTEEGKPFEEKEFGYSTVSGEKGELEIGIQEAVQYWASIKNVDNLVLTVVEDEFQKALGRSGRTNKFQIAMKFNPANAEGYVQGLTLTTGRKGYRTIQIELDKPVFLDGVRYDHIPVLSANLFDTMDLRIGSKVNIHRVGDVIPSISVIRSGNGKKLTIPIKCPDCGEFLEIKNKKMYCANPMCPGNTIGRFIGFFNGMDLDGYSDSAAEILYHDLNCRSISDILKLNKEDFKEAKVKSDNLQKLPELLKDAITKHYDFEVLGAFGLPGIGKERAKMILNSFAFSRLHEMTGKDATTMSIASIAFVSGDSNSRMLLKHVLKDPVVQKDLKTLAKYVTKTRSKEKTIRVGHTGGNLNPEVKDCCRANGFEIVDGKSFDVLITKDLTSESEKMNIARTKNLPIYDENSFLSYYGEE